MMRVTMLVASLTMLTGTAAALSPSDLTGEWEIQTMGPNRLVTISQKGSNISVHRIMWTVFDGQRVKLEHMYKGKISGGEITGKLFVKDQGQTSYEELRRFTGSVKDSKVDLDGMPLRKRTKTARNATTTPRA